MTGHIKSINCTNCGAGLEVIGGGRVTTKVCSYCGAALDATDAFKVLEVFSEMKRPDSPFRLGMQGDWNGVTFTIIGTIGQQESYGGQTWTWVDHQLYSPTHGYAWLTVEDGHTIITRKVRDWPQRQFITEHVVENAENPPNSYWRQQRFTYYSSSNWQTVFVEGEFNWRPRRGALGYTASLLNNGDDLAMLHYVSPISEGARAERELEVSYYWPEAAAAFGVRTIPVPKVHPLQPYDDKAATGILKVWFAALCVATVALAIWISSLQPPGQAIYSGMPGDLPPLMTFTITDPTRPAQIALRQDLSNAFAFYTVKMTGPDGTVMAETGREVSYYSGGSGDDAWSEGSRRSTLNFVPPVAGEYKLTLTPDPSGTLDAPLKVSVAEGRRNALWLWLALPVFLLCLAWQWTGRIRHNKARWAGTDWYDD
ncbi:DUF4178 domain-containing protein [Jannaschia pohangensis]|uniref:DUF4178 domain-containing protein n=1 Tax=Jannaschia pohangensis TaxID=390807 RepID=A0A1I3RX42_9RHOB|nr:DUF4178 domain-containing protein [Jannaschia pohangensis]SFJ51174.1 protein of unknown function [Jannaschia pohangensis]